VRYGMAGRASRRLTKDRLTSWPLYAKTEKKKAQDKLLRGLDKEVDEDDDDDDAGWNDDGEGGEEIYNFETGWKLDGEEEEEAAEEEDAEKQQMEAELIAGLRITPKLKKQLQRAALEVRDPKKAKEDAKSAFVKSRKVHTKMRIISGRFGGVRLLSPDDQDVRPMMEKVRAAVFSMIQSVLGTGTNLPENTRWLDLFSGTGAVGLEGMSQGCTEAHFVEADPWVVSNVLGKNIEKCKVDYETTVHTAYVEKWLANANEFPQSVGGVFDFISVTPPYVKVSYPELMGLLDQSPLIGPETIVIVEYARREKSQIPDDLGPLVKIRDRKYGRTFVAMYGPLGAFEDEYDDDEDDDDE